jgi:hypothetical protein
MKLAISICLLFICVSSGKAQNTTQEEFNYMSKGFARMISEGLDLKKGYFLSDTAQFSIEKEKYRFTFLNLKRVADKSLAGTIVIVKSSVSNNIYYLGIPAANKDMSIDLNPTLMAQISNYNWDFSIRSAFMLAVSEYFMLLNTTKAKQGISR